MRLLDVKIKELLDTKGDCNPIAIIVDSVDRLEHIIEIINSYRTIKIGAYDTFYYLQQMKEQNKILKVFIGTNNEVNFDSSATGLYPEWEIVKDVDILKPVTQKPIHDAVYCNPNKNVDAMLNNFFGALNEIVENKQTKIKSEGNKVKDVLKVFDKGQVDIKQIIVQMYLKDLTSNVPFVNELVRKELARIKNKIVTDFNPIHNLDTYNLKFLASVDYLEDIKNCDSVVDLECAYMFYVYEKEIAKELRLTGKPDYSWIKEFLIQKNVMSSKRVDLFKSKKFEIFIEDGSIHLVDVKPNIGYYIDIKYNEAEKTFHL